MDTHLYRIEEVKDPSKLAGNYWEKLAHSSECQMEMSRSKLAHLTHSTLSRTHYDANE